MPSLLMLMCFFSPLDIPVIPDLDEVQEEDLTMQVAAPPRYTAPSNPSNFNRSRKGN